jgi:hypothetical protein
MLCSHGSGQQQINDNGKSRQIAGNFDFHVDVMVQNRAHCMMEHIQGIT